MAAPRRHRASERPKAAFRLGRCFRLLRAARGRGRKRNAVGNVPPTCVSGQRRASLSAQDNKMQIASHPQGRLLAPTHSRRSLADQLVVVIPKEGRREGGRGDGDGDGGEIEGLASVLRPYHSLQSAGSAAVSKLKLTGSAAAPPPPSL